MLCAINIKMGARRILIVIVNGMLSLHHDILALHIDSLWGRTRGGVKLVHDGNRAGAVVVVVIVVVMVIGASVVEM